MRDAALAVIREIGVETGGSNIQFAVNPENGRMIVIEMNPRVSRSSALASKATGFPIAKIAAKLAVGYTLDEIPNDITRETPACFEPTIDYVVVKMPRFAFEKFPRRRRDARPADEVGRRGDGDRPHLPGVARQGAPLAGDRPLRASTSSRAADARRARSARSRDAGARSAVAARPRRCAPACRIERGATRSPRSIPGSCATCAQMVDEDEAARARRRRAARRPGDAARGASALGMSDRRLDEAGRRRRRRTSAQARIAHGVRPVYKRVDTCAAEFEAHTPYLYSTYETGSRRRAAAECEARADRQEEDRHPRRRPQPHRPGHRVRLLLRPRRAWRCARTGYRDHHGQLQPGDGVDRLRHRPTGCTSSRSRARTCSRSSTSRSPTGVIVQFGGQTPLRAGGAAARTRACKLLGTSADAIDRAEDRQRFGELHRASSACARRAWGTAHGLDEAREVADRIGYPVMVRPSLRARRPRDGDRPRRVGPRELRAHARWRPRAARAWRRAPARRTRPILIDQFLADAIEVDVDVVADGTDVVVGGVMEHIEEAGIHSGDSACCLPPYSLPPETVEAIKTQARALARELGVRGLMNVQFAVPRDGRGIFILEVNPRASRTVPFVSKVTGVPLAKIAARIAVGRTLDGDGRPRGDAQARRGQGGGVPVREVRGRRHAPRPRDALDRRGDGHRHRASPRAFAQEPDRRRARSCRRAGTRVPLGAATATRRAPSRSRKRPRRPRLRGASPPRGTHDVPAQRRARRRAHQQGARGAPALRRRASSTATIHLVINTTAGAQAIQRLVPHPPHRAAARASPTTRRCRAARAAVGAIADAARAARCGVRSLQEYHRRRADSHGQVPDDPARAAARSRTSSSGCARSSAPRTCTTSKRRARHGDLTENAEYSRRQGAPGLHRGALARHRVDARAGRGHRSGASCRAARSCSAPR